MEVKELRIKIPAALHHRLTVAASERMLRIGPFSRQILVNGLNDYEKSGPDRRYYLLENKKE